MAAAEDQVAFDYARKLFKKQELAQLLGRTPRTLRRWETGESALPVGLGSQIREILHSSGSYGDDTPRDYTFVDLFAGIGGIRKGFEAHGGRCVFTSEWDKYAARSYRANFPNDDHEINGDITAISEWSIPNHDVLLAGFPCQPFSIAGVSKKKSLGRAHGFLDETQGTLFYDVARIIKAKRPAAFVLENVKNLVSHDKGRTFEVIMATLREELGYQVDWKVIDARHFVPQHRERILVVGFREHALFSWDDLQLPDHDGQHPTMATVLHPEDGSEVPEEPYTDEAGKVSDKYVLSKKLWGYLKAYAEKHRQKGNGFGYGMVGPGDVARTLSARYYKDGSEILVNRGRRRNPRRLTPRECARLMGFDSGDHRMEIPVSDTQAYKQFGNSVVVPVIAEVARIMRPHVLQIMATAEDAPLQESLF